MDEIQDWESEGGMVVTSGYVYSCTKCKNEIESVPDNAAYKEYQICAACLSKIFPNEVLQEEQTE